MFLVRRKRCSHQVFTRCQFVTIVFFAGSGQPRPLSNSRLQQRSGHQTEPSVRGCVCQTGHQGPNICSGVKQQQQLYSASSAVCHSRDGGESDPCSGAVSRYGNEKKMEQRSVEHIPVHFQPQGRHGTGNYHVRGDCRSASSTHDCPGW